MSFKSAMIPKVLTKDVLYVKECYMPSNEMDLEKLSEIVEIKSQFIDSKEKILTWFNDKNKNFKETVSMALYNKKQTSVLNILNQLKKTSDEHKVTLHNHPYNDEDNMRNTLISMATVIPSLMIFQNLDEITLAAATNVSKTWNHCIKAAKDEKVILYDRSLKLNSQCNDKLSCGGVSTYAKVIIPKPRIDENVSQVFQISKVQKSTRGTLKHQFTHRKFQHKDPTCTQFDYNLPFCLDDVNHYEDSWSRIQEERDVYLNSFTVLVLLDKNKFPDRVIHTDNRNWMAFCDGGENQRKIKFISNLDFATLGPMSKSSEFSTHLVNTSLVGHAASVRSLWMLSDLQLLLSASFDHSIRLWDLAIDFKETRSRCIRIFKGHSDMIHCLWIDKDNRLPTDAGEVRNKMDGLLLEEQNRVDVMDHHLVFASGSEDCTCKIWRLNQKEALLSLLTDAPVTAVCLKNHLCATGESQGQITVWLLQLHLQVAKKLKVIAAHAKGVTALQLDGYHLVSASCDGSVRIWTTVQGYDGCLANIPHSQSVSCLYFNRLRLVTGCSDGYIRIWNVRNGKCQRIIKGNSLRDPIQTLIALPKVLIVGSQSNVILLNFNIKIENKPKLPSGQHSQNQRGGLQSNLESIVYRQSETNRPPSASAMRRYRARLSGQPDYRIMSAATVQSSRINAQSRREFMALSSLPMTVRCSKPHAWSLKLSPSHKGSARSFVTKGKQTHLKLSTSIGIQVSIDTDFESDGDAENSQPAPILSSKNFKVDIDRVIRHIPRILDYREYIRLTSPVESPGSCKRSDETPQRNINRQLVEKKRSRTLHQPKTYNKSSNQIKKNADHVQEVTIDHSEKRSDKRRIKTSFPFEDFNTADNDLHPAWQIFTKPINLSTNEFAFRY